MPSCELFSGCYAELRLFLGTWSRATRFTRDVVPSYVMFRILSLRSQFGLSGFVFCMASVAVLVAYAIVAGSWSESLYLTACIWLVVGLLQQVGDLLHARRGYLLRDDGSPRVVKHIEFAMLWRCLFSTLISLKCVDLVMVLHGSKGIRSWLDVRGPDDFGIANLCLEGFYFLALITAMSAAPWNWHSMTRPWSLRRQVLDFIVSCLFAVVVLAPTMLLTAMVHLAIAAIEAYEPITFLEARFLEPDIPGYIKRLHTIAIISGGMLLWSILAAGLVYWTSRATRTWRWIALLASILLVGGAFVAACHSQGFRSISPHLWDSRGFPSQADVVAVSLLLGYFAMVVAYRLQPMSIETHAGENVTWHRGAGHYLHESRLFSVAIALVILDQLMMVRGFSGLFRAVTWRNLGDMLQIPELYYLPLATFALALRGIFARKLTESDLQCVSLGPLDWQTLVFMAIAMAVVIITLVEAVVWSSFVLWLM